MPNTERKIRGRLEELQSELDGLGDFPQSEAACRTIVHPRLSSTLRRLLDQYTGRDDKLGSQTFGRMVQLQVTVEDLAAEFEKTAGAAEGTATKCSKPLRSPAVEIEGLKGTTVQLELFACYVDDAEQAAGKRCNVAAFVDVTRGAGVESVSLEWDLCAAEGPDRAPLAENLDIEHSWTDAASAGYGGVLITGAAARKLNHPVTFTADIFVGDVERADADADAPSADTICAGVATLDKSLERDLNGLYPRRYFFKPQLRQVIEAEMKHRQGAASGMPGAIMPEVAVAVLEQLRKPVLALLKRHIDAVATTIRAAVTAEIEDAMAAFPRLCDRLLATVDSMFDAQRARAHASAEDIMLWEQQVHTSNHYYMDTVTKLRESINDEDFVADDTSMILTTDAERMRTAISNQQQNLVDMQIQLFAYWKVMKKRLLDYVQMATRSVLVAVPLRTLLHKRLQAEVEAAARSPGLVVLMAPDPQRQQRYETAKARQVQLTKAAAEMKAARSGIDDAASPSEA